jgi:hypothetical protein
MPMADKDLIRADVAALMVVMATIIEALDVGQPGVKQVLVATLQKAADSLPDQEHPDSIKLTLQGFNKVISKGRRLDSQFQ